MEFLHESGHEKFNYDNIDELKEKLQELGQKLPFSDDYDVLFAPVEFKNISLPNSFAVQPMEGCDASRDGVPGKLTFRRYKRFAAGGSGLLWMEATAVKRRGKANPYQLMMTEKTAPELKKMRQEVQKAARESMGTEHKPLMVVQLTHSGRYSKPNGFPEPIIAHHSEVLDHKHDLEADYPLISDQELDELQENYVTAAGLAAEAGFKAVDIKACHGYLLNEILGSHTRKNSKYGGSYENRTRFIKEVAQKIKKQNPELIVGTRLNVYDAMPYPYGFGMAEDGSMKPDLTEPIRLIKELADIGVEIVNIAVGNPYYNPHVERPFDSTVDGGYIPGEHPLENIGENMKITRKITEAVGDRVLTVASGLSWLRQFVPDVGAGLVKEKWAKIIGLGRAPFAYPDLVKDLQEKGKLIKNKLCISCSSCTQMMRDGVQAGCPVRDSEVYAPIYRQGRLKSTEYVSELAEICRDCAPASCQGGCPANVDIPGFIQSVARGEDKKAYSILRQTNNLPEVCAYICPAEAQCEGECVQANIGEGPVPIQDIQRYVSEKAREEGWAQIEVQEKSNERIAVIGAGPAGLSCATELLERGYQVTIFDAGEKPGGTAEEVIPEERLKDKIFAREVKAIMGQVPEDRVTWKFEQSLGQDFSLAEVKENYDAVFLGPGLTESTSLPLGETKPEGVYQALDFLREIKGNTGLEVPAKVAVIGGGNTAMDAASQAAERLGEEGDVYLIYRRSFKQMPAWPAERDNAQKKGVHFLILQQPTEYVTDEQGNLTGIKMVRTELGRPDESGRRSPRPVEGTEQLINVDLAIEAVGQRLASDLKDILNENGIELSEGLIVTEQDSQQTSISGIFAGGDIINGGKTVVQAVFEGAEAAREIDDYLGQE
ncbi:MAG: FAD-dependent oxidoreductase [Bacillota bacterium]